MAMIFVSIEELHTSLDKLLHAVKAGGHVIITDDNVPVARLDPVRARGKREMGGLKEHVSIGPEFFEPLPDEELAAWEG
jgi:antitoxin (DNA-binding transcriptional repressor) of toxin-antitoxin stability system